MQLLCLSPEATNALVTPQASSYVGGRLKQVRYCQAMWLLPCGRSVVPYALSCICVSAYEYWENSGGQLTVSDLPVSAVV